MDALTAMIAGQSWFETVCFTVAMANSVTVFLNDKIMNGNPILKKINMVLNFLAMNIFNNKNKRSYKQ